MGRIVVIRDADYSQVALDHVININVDVASSGGGSVSGGGAYELGEEFSISAVPAEGFRFVQWSDGDTSIVRTLTAGSCSTNYTATFAGRLELHEIIFYGQVLVGYGAAPNSLNNGLKDVSYAERASRGVWMVPTDKANDKITFGSASISSGANTGMTVAELAGLGYIPLVIDKSCIGKTLTFTVGEGGRFRFAVAFMQLTQLQPAKAINNDPYDSGWVSSYTQQSISVLIEEELFGECDYIMTNLSVAPVNDSSTFTQADISAINEAIVTII